MKYDLKQIKAKLRTYLNREPNENEIENSQKDANIICEILSEEIEDLKKRVTKLEI